MTRLYSFCCDSSESVKTNVTNGKAPKGILTVNAHFTDADIKNIENDEQVTVLALQVIRGIPLLLLIMLLLRLLITRTWYWQL
mgnify:CR=1 FL=1